MSSGSSFFVFFQISSGFTAHTQMQVHAPLQQQHSLPSAHYAQHVHNFTEITNFCLPCVSFLEIHRHCNCCGHLVHRVTKIGERCTKYGTAAKWLPQDSQLLCVAIWGLTHPTGRARSKNVSSTVDYTPIFVKLALVQNVCTELHEISTNGLVTDTRSQLPKEPVKRVHNRIRHASCSATHYYALLPTCKTISLHTGSRQSANPHV